MRPRHRAGRGDHPAATAHHTAPLGVRGLLGIALVALLVLAGVVIAGVFAGREMRAGDPGPAVNGPAPASRSETVGATPPPSAPVLSTPPADSAVPADPATLTAEFAELQSRLPATVGLVLRPIGSDGSAVTLGDWSKGPAWSTIKVPLVLAGLSESGTEEPTADMVSAIEASDNAAAERIWAGLGDPSSAAEKVQQVLRGHGDGATVVQSQKVRPEFSAFGQTEWTLTNQANFLAAAGCAPAFQPVAELMRQINADQRWGLGTVPNAAFKGGWGPSPSGAYLVRQYGILDTPAGQTVVAIAAEPNSGSFGDGTAALTQIADWLSDRLAALPAGTCS